VSRFSPRRSAICRSLKPWSINRWISTSRAGVITGPSRTVRVRSKNDRAPPDRYCLSARFTLIADTPKARSISTSLQAPPSHSMLD
jgi:hypothetical protein